MYTCTRVYMIRQSRHRQSKNCKTIVVVQKCGLCDVLWNQWRYCGIVWKIEIPEGMADMEEHLLFKRWRECLIEISLSIDAFQSSSRACFVNDGKGHDSCSWAEVWACHTPLIYINHRLVWFHQKKKASQILTFENRHVCFVAFLKHLTCWI